MLSNLTFIDLTQTLAPGIAQYDLKCGFEHTFTTQHETHGFEISEVKMATGTGTHIDAPRHFYCDTISADAIPLRDLICPLVVIDIRKQVENDCDYALSIRDIHHYENTSGDIPAGAFVAALTGWDKFWEIPERYKNLDKHSTMHFPGFSEDAANFLLNKNIRGIGIDTLSLDIGRSRDFPVHKIILGHGLYQLENLTNLEQALHKKSSIIILPMKIKDAPEAPVRVIAALE